jgi:hypothetical protein
MNGPYVDDDDDGPSRHSLLHFTLCTHTKFWVGRVLSAFSSPSGGDMNYNNPPSRTCPFHECEFLLCVRVVCEILCESKQI